MGCAPSSAKITSNESYELIQEIEQLKRKQQEKEEEISNLRNENNALRKNAECEGIANGGVDLDDEIVKELELLRLENEDLKGKISGLQTKQVVALQSSGKPLQSSENLPKVGDKVLSMWSVSMWQYFTASIVSFDSASLQFTIEWDDQDTSGRIVDYYNLALDRIPDDDEIAVGSIVLFPQGQYRGQEGVRLGGERWHQGRITDVSHGPGGEKVYDGVHTKGSPDGKWITFKGYEPTFEDLKIHQLRIAPNVLDLLSAEAASAPPSRAGMAADDVIDPCDVFISYSKVNSASAVRNNEVDSSELPPSYEEAMKNMCDPQDIRSELQQIGLKVNVDTGGNNLKQTVSFINSSSVFIAFLSDEYANDEICRQEFQYAKKTAKKPVIPVVVGESFNWMMSVVGLLIAGELYIHFKDRSIQEMKMQELIKAVNRNVQSHDAVDTGTTQEAVAAVPKPLKTADVFISYCWWNSAMAHDASQIPQLVGSKFSDPRKIKMDLSIKSNMAIWLDTERLRTTNQNDSSMGMFEQIAKGLGNAKVVVVFVSKEYAISDNCRMEFQFALKSLRKPIVPVIVGEGDGWQDTVVGLLVSSQETQPVNLQPIETESQYNDALAKIDKAVKSLLGFKEQTTTYRAPVIGDHVVCFHQRWAYYYATVIEFNRETMEYKVTWDDGDPSGRVQSYKDVGLDDVPTSDQIGVDSIVFFSQGSYSGTEGNNIGGGRFHEGVITKVHKDASGATLYDGHHTKGESDGKWVTYKNYDYNFTHVPLSLIRIAPNAMDALMACKHAFDVTD